MDSQALSPTQGGNPLEFTSSNEFNSQSILHESCEANNIRAVAWGGEPLGNTGQSARARVSQYGRKRVLTIIQAKRDYRTRN